MPSNLIPCIDPEDGSTYEQSSKSAIWNQTMNQASISGHDRTSHRGETESATEGEEWRSVPVAPTRPPRKSRYSRRRIHQPQYQPADEREEIISPPKTTAKPKPKFAVPSDR